MQMEKIVHDERQDERTYCILSRPCKTRLCYLETRKVRTESDLVALDLQSDYITHLVAVQYATGPRNN